MFRSGSKHRLLRAGTASWASQDSGRSATVEEDDNTEAVCSREETSLPWTRVEIAFSGSGSLYVSLESFPESNPKSSCKIEILL